MPLRTGFEMNFVLPSRCQAIGKRDRNFQVILLARSLFNVALREKCPNTEFFGPYFTARKNSVFGHFSRSVGIFDWSEVEVKPDVRLLTQ